MKSEWVLPESQPSGHCVILFTPKEAGGDSRRLWREVAAFIGALVSATVRAVSSFDFLRPANWPYG